MRRLLVIVLATFLLAATPDLNRPVARAQPDILQFSTAAAVTARTTLTRENLDRFGVLWRTALPEGSDGVPVVAANLLTEQGMLNLIVAETMTGRLVALNARTGEMIWQTEPPAGPRWTTSSPAIDPNKNYVYAYALDGYVHRHRLITGEEVRGAGWPALITRKGAVEKGSSDIAIATAADGKTYLYMPVSAYPEPGDDGDYQGHLTVIELATGAQKVFNALCSNRTAHFDNSRGGRDCQEAQAGIWARPGAVYDKVTDRVFVTVGNGAFNAQNGGYHWGSSVVALHPDGHLNAGAPMDSYTPVDFQRLSDEDLDLSSTTITILPLAAGSKLPHMGVQSGKDGVLRLLNLRDLSGQHGPRHLGGELDQVALPQGGVVLTQPVAWLEPVSRETWIYVVSDRGMAAFSIDPDAPKFVPEWTNTSLLFNSTPVMLNGLLFMVGSNALSAVDARTGEVVWQDKGAGPTHWQSPTIVNSMIYVCDSAGYLTAYGAR
jgi:outer membrane protein assembly factor BamB